MRTAASRAGTVKGESLIYFLRLYSPVQKKKTETSIWVELKEQTKKLHYELNTSCLGVETCLHILNTDWYVNNTSGCRIN